MKIMIVDDSDASRILLETILQRSGYHNLVMADSANHAFDRLKKADSVSNGDPVDLILMDIVMPGIDGIDATRLIKSNKRLKDIPIIMVTVRNEEESLEQAFNAGAIDYINKPVRKIELRARIRSVLRLKQEIDHRKARERELQVLTRKLEQLSNLDGLTHLPNRRCFDRIWAKEWRRAVRQAKPISIMMIDIDFFKLYNDCLGHLMGDMSLKKVAAAISETLIRPGDFMARYGGEEFVVILPDTDMATACRIGEQVRRTVAELKIEHKASRIDDILTISIGIAGTLPCGKVESRSLLSAADEALYEAKRRGRNRVWPMA